MHGPQSIPGLIHILYLTLALKRKKKKKKSLLRTPIFQIKDYTLLIHVDKI